MAVKNLFLFFATLLIVCDGAPKRSKKGDNVPHTVYDQQQTGDYNIQLHLKDFQIIAVLGDDAAGLGDYDYTYDYSDFTIKPSSPKPTEASSLSTSSKPPVNVSTSKPPQTPYPFLILNSTNATHLVKPEDKPTEAEKPFPAIKPASPETPLLEETPSSTESAVPASKPVATEQTSLPETSATENITPLTLIATVSNNSTTQKSSKLDEPASAGKIKVQIIETPIRMNIVPGEEIEQPEMLPQGEILQLRRCASGFTRDKRGRCRRVRRPGNQSQIPFGFSRLASNLASRFRHTSEESSKSSSSESRED